MEQLSEKNVVINRVPAWRNICGMNFFEPDSDADAHTLSYAYEYLLSLNAHQRKPGLDQEKMHALVLSLKFKL